MADRVGQQLGNYRLIRLLGEGGFAEVYLGEHIHLGTHAAIKMLHTQLASDDAEKFRIEAKTIAQLLHPNIVRVLEFGIDDKTPFMVMDYAPNGTLRQKHTRGSILSPATILPYIKQTAAALQYAHDMKYIHRDIKPENMLLGRQNEVLLSDFGIALVAQSSRFQSTQEVIGTVAYMSPEQIQGKPRPASDQYSLAVVAYEWLSGDRPFHGSFTELCTQHMFATPTPIRQKLPNVSPDVEHIILTALAKDPHQRFGSIQAFANAFEQAIKPGRIPDIRSTPLPPPPVYTQYIAPPPPATVYAPPPPPLQQASFADSGSYNSRPIFSDSYGYGNTPNYGNGYAQNYSNSYTPAQRVSAPPAVPRQRNPWAIGKREILAALIGTIIYSICNYILDVQYVNNPSFNAPINTPFFTFNIGNIPTPISSGIVWGDLIFAIPLFLAVAYGPWVGMFAAGLGTYLTDYFSRYLSFFNIPWYYYVGYVLIACIASIAYMRARGRNTPGASGIPGTPVFSAIVWTILGLIIGGGFTGFLDAQTYHDATFGWSVFIYYTLPQPIVMIVVYIIVLAIYNSSVRSSQHNQGYR